MKKTCEELDHYLEVREGTKQKEVVCYNCGTYARYEKAYPDSPFRQTKFTIKLHDPARLFKIPPSKRIKDEHAPEGTA